MESLSRQQSNFLILGKLLEYFKKNPDIRFTQALYNLGINEDYIDKVKADSKSEELLLNRSRIRALKDKYNEESLTTLNNIKDK